MKIEVLYITPDEEARRLVIQADDGTDYLEESIREDIGGMIPERTCNLPFFIIGHYTDEKLPVVFDSEGNEVISGYEDL